jgi:GntR family transcriptional regulator, transcriptional repressor for pyruvate dehydrogenase complex
MGVTFAQPRVEPAYRKVAAALLRRIVARQLRDGDQLPTEIELARQFGVNRSTVREAYRELESSGLLGRRRGSKRMVVTRPEAGLVAEGVSRALVLHDVSFLDVWEALTILEPPIAEAAARRRSAMDRARLQEVAARYAAENRDTTQAVRLVPEFFRVLGAASHNTALMLAHEPLIQLIGPSLGAMIDRVPQARARIGTAQRRLCEALESMDAEGARTWMARHIRDFRRGYEVAGIKLEHRVGKR